MRVMLAISIWASFIAQGDLGIESGGGNGFALEVSRAYCHLLKPRLRTLSEKAPCLSEKIVSVFENAPWQMVEEGFSTCEVTPSFLENSIDSADPIVRYERALSKCSEQAIGSLILIRALGKLNYDWTIETMLTVSDVILSGNLSLKNREIGRLEVETCGNLH